METYKDHITMSPDINEERLETLRNLFPDWFTQEGHLDINEVKKAVNQIVWMRRNVMNSAGLASRRQSAMPSRRHVPPFTMMRIAA